MLLWHLGATVALTRYAFRDERMDLRFLAFGAILPDLVDTPIGLIFYDGLRSVRLFTHSLLVAAALMTWILFATRRGRPRKRWMPVAIGVLIHLFLDGMWAEPATLWWPFLGAEFAAAGAETIAEYVGNVLSNWWVWLGEVIGAAYLVNLARRSGLAGATERRDFFATGRVNAPIGGSPPGPAAER